MDMFRRVVEDAVDNWLESKQKALFVHGLPGVGKTTLVKEKIKERGPVYEVDCHDRRIQRAVRAVNPLMALQRFLNGQRVPTDSFLVFYHADECPELIELTKSLLSSWQHIVMVFDRYDKTLSKSRFFPLGYATELKIEPMSFTEYCWASGIGQNEIRRYCEVIKNGKPLSDGVFQRFQQLWDHYLFVGGFPPVIAADAEGRWDERELNLTNTRRAVIEWIRDSYGKKAQTVYASVGTARSGYFDRFVPTRATKGGTAGAYSDSIDLLSKKGLITAVPYWSNGNPTKDCSLYDCDPGLMRLSLGIDNELDLSTQQYYLLEMGVLARALQRSGYRLHKEHVYGYSPDLICEGGDGEFAVELKSARNIRLRIDKVLAYPKGRGLFVLSSNNAVSRGEGLKVLPTCMFALMAEGGLL